MISRNMPGRASSPADPVGSCYFVFGRAKETTDLEMTYRIRYQVYCVERGLLCPDDYPDGLESDPYDVHSVHILATHCSGEPAGTARLVLSSPLGFPVLDHCQLAGPYAHLADPSYPGLDRYAEISRLAVSKTFRRRAGDTPYGGPPRYEDGFSSRRDVIELPQLQRSPEILVGICRELYQESKRRGISNWLLAMERSLYLMLKRMGFRFFPAGPEVDYYGPVRPYVTSIKEFELGLYDTSPEMLHYLASGLSADLMPDCVRDRERRISRRASVA